MKLAKEAMKKVLVDSIKKQTVPFNMQFFAGEGDPPPVPDPEPPIPPKTYTQEELEQLIASSMAKEKAKLEKDFKSKKQEAERLAAMNEEERKQEEFKQQLAEFEQEKEKFEFEKSKLEAMKILKERQLDESFVDFVISSDAEETLKRINTFDKLFKEAVKSEVDERLKTKPPKMDPETKDVTKEQFKKMSLAQQSELYTKNEELYMKLASSK